MEMERAAGIEPACLTWKDSALPLSYARMRKEFSPKLGFKSSRFFTHLNDYFENLKYFGPTRSSLDNPKEKKFLHPTGLSGDHENSKATRSARR